jgi:hypothetical protein
MGIQRNVDMNLVMSAKPPHPSTASGFVGGYAVGCDMMMQAARG